MSPSPPALRDVLAAHDRLIEVGIGHRTEIAAALADRGCHVTAIDVHPRSVPTDVEFVREDLLDPGKIRDVDIDAIYALRLPPELQAPAARLADELGVPLYFTTLGNDPAIVESRARPIQEGTLFVAGAGDQAPRD
ncbi:MAG: UPF0146 family protein [Halodesulfurarchaeum sp.]